MPKRTNQTSVPGLMQPRPSPKPRMRMRATNRDAISLDFRSFTYNIGAVFSSTAPAIYLVRPTTSGGAVAGVSSNYQEYTFSRHTVEYTPSVGTTTSGVIWAAYFDNAEIITKALTGTYSATQIEEMVKYSQHVESWPVWQCHTCNTPLRRRRLRYQVDPTPPTFTTEVVDRTVHGMWILFSEGLESGAAGGSLYTNANVSLQGLQNGSATGI